MSFETVKLKLPAELVRRARDHGLDVEAAAREAVELKVELAGKLVAWTEVGADDEKPRTITVPVDPRTGVPVPYGLAQRPAARAAVSRWQLHIPYTDPRGNLLNVALAARHLPDEDRRVTEALVEGVVKIRPKITAYTLAWVIENWTPDERRRRRSQPNGGRRARRPAGTSPSGAGTGSRWRETAPTAAGRTAGR